MQTYDVFWCQSIRDAMHQTGAYPRDSRYAPKDESAMFDALIKGLKLGQVVVVVTLPKEVSTGSDVSSARGSLRFSE